MATPQTRPDGVPPVAHIARMTTVMDCLSDAFSTVTLDQVAHRTRLSRSSTYRILRHLTEAGWVEYSAGRYRLGERAVGITGPDVAHLGLRRAASPVLAELRRSYGIHFHLCVLTAGRVQVIDSVLGERAYSPWGIGDLALATSCASGLAMLSTLDTFDAEKRLAASGSSAGLGALRTASPRPGAARVRMDVGGEVWHSAAEAIPGPRREAFAAIEAMDPATLRLDAAQRALTKAARAIASALADQSAARDRRQNSRTMEAGA
ncbi:helix-turn-helix domain-containing protein [Pimelobacter simplex]|uniref:helix-turn-helix domain-containing protein n=1 Tax=Nocardioides simplex TaxID=2045 RepID=UPI001931A1C9|nr:helix-turn-helix domain-containing protein [Pimelobacter simplex]